MIAQTNEYILMIDYAEKYGYRLALWEKPASLMDKPQTVVYNGIYELEGTLHNLYASFTADDGRRYDVTDFDGPGFYIAEPGVGPVYFAMYEPADALFTMYADEDATGRCGCSRCPLCRFLGSPCGILVLVGAVVLVLLAAAFLFFRCRKTSDKENQER